MCEGFLQVHDELGASSPYRVSLVVGIFWMREICLWYNGVAFTEVSKFLENKKEDSADKPQLGIDTGGEYVNVAYFCHVYISLSGGY